jgi:hypothetical protein
MKSAIMRILLVLSFASTVFAGATLYYFNARSENDNIKLEWKTQDEINLKHFVIERKNPNGPFVELATLQPKGENSYYYYIDESAYKTTDLVFIYRLKIVENDNKVSLSSEVTVSHSISGVKRTWGSIKAMFR